MGLLVASARSVRNFDGETEEFQWEAAGAFEGNLEQGASGSDSCVGIRLMP